MGFLMCPLGLYKARKSVLGDVLESLLQGRLRNTTLPVSRAMLPLYEAVVNSIHAIEEDATKVKRAISDYQITITIIRDQSLLSSQARGEDRIAGFLVEDNGCGFTIDNWNSFKTLDSDYKAQKGSRGIGRLMWLKAFKEVEVSSIYAEGDLLKRRHFLFHPVRGIEPLGEPEATQEPKRTIVKLSGFESRYSEHAFKTLRAIACGVLEHCLWYFVRNEGVPSMRVMDGDEYIQLDALFDEHMHVGAKAEVLPIGLHSFELTHVKFRASMNKSNTISYCAAGRVVRNEPLQGRVPGLTNTMTDDVGAFTYAVYVTSFYLDERVSAQRIGFDLDDESDGLFADAELSLKNIRDAVVPRVKVFLSDCLQENIAASAERIQTFVARTAPRYRSILRHINEDEFVVDPSIADRELDLALHKQLYKIEEQILNDGHQIMVPLPNETEQEYQRRLEDYLQTVSDLKQSDLANYVMHRRTVIDLLEAAINSDGSGNFTREDVIHELIVPMRSMSDDYTFRRENLWLIDERLAFHDFLASDMPLSKYVQSTSQKEPDIASLRLFDNPFLISERGSIPGSLTVVEIKRPMRKGYQSGEDEKTDPILQALRYLTRLRRGSAAKGGRPVPNADRMPGFVYVLADLTESLVECCQLHQLSRTPDGMGYFGYHRDPVYNAYIQVMSFDGLVAGAKERNRAFFDKLGLPAK